MADSESSRKSTVEKTAEHDCQQMRLRPDEPLNDAAGAAV